MGTIKNGQPNGKTGEHVTYPLLGKLVTRTIGVNNTPPTDAQLAGRQAMALGNAVLAPIKPFIKIGFKMVAAKIGMYPANRALSHIKLNAINGSYPEQYIDYSKLLVAEGKLPMAENPVVEKTESGLKFNWDKVKTFPRNMDQTMLLAYFPDLDKAEYITAGAKRSAGEDFLEIRLSRINERMEVYMAFISEDRENVSNSVYLKQFEKTSNLQTEAGTESDYSII